MLAKPLSVLWLSPFVPYPPDHGGAVRLFNLLRCLAPHCAITLCALTDAAPPAEAVTALQTWCRAVHIFRRSRRPRLFPPRLAPPAVYYDDVPEMHRRVRSLQADCPSEILQIDYPSLAQYMTYRRSSAAVLTELDVTYLSCYRRFRTERWPSKWRRFLGFVLFFYYELRHLPRFDAVITMSEHDRAELRRRLPNLPVVVIPNGMDCDHFTPPEVPASSPTVLFVGNFQHPPNVDAVTFFARQIWPALAARFADLQFVIVGAPSPEVQALAGPRICLAGPARNYVPLGPAPAVPDIRRYYRQAQVVIAPIRYGSGTRLKLLEAFAAGVPVVSTPLGAEGLEVRHESHLLLAGTAAEFVEQTARLLTDADLRREISRHARRLVTERYDWKILAQKQLELYERLNHRAGA